MSRSKSPATSPSEASTPSSQPQTLGGVLAAARQKSGISVEEAARILRLRPSVLRELEQDDLRSFDHASYARMTLLGYARILRLPEESIRPWLPQATGFQTSESHYLHRLASSDQTLKDKTHFENGPRTGKSLSNTLKVFMVLVLILGAGYGYMLWRNLGRLQPASTPVIVLPTPTPSILETLENARALEESSAAGQENPPALDLHSSSAGTPATTGEEDFSKVFSDDGLALDLPLALPVLPALPVETPENIEETAEEDSASADGETTDDPTLESSPEVSPEATPEP